MPYSEYIQRVHKLELQVGRASAGPEFRSALCNLISEIPETIESEARRLCQEVMCPPAGKLVEHLQRDIETHSDEPEQAIVFYPLMRVAVAIRSGEMTKVG